MKDFFVCEKKILVTDSFIVTMMLEMCYLATIIVLVRIELLSGVDAWGHFAYEMRIVQINQSERRISIY